MTRARSIHLVALFVLAVAGALSLRLQVGKEREPGALSAPPPRVEVADLRRVAPQTTPLAPSAGPSRDLPAPPADEPLELRADFRSRAERHQYYDARTQYELDVATALRQVAGELSEIVDEDEGELGPESARAAGDVNVPDLDQRISELEAEAGRHAGRGQRYAELRAGR